MSFVTLKFIQLTTQNYLKEQKKTKNIFNLYSKLHYYIYQNYKIEISKMSIYSMLHLADLNVQSQENRANIRALNIFTLFKEINFMYFKKSRSCRLPFYSNSN